MYLSIAGSPNYLTNKDSFGCCAVDMFLSALFIAMISTSNVRIKLGVGGLLSTGYIQCCNLQRSWHCVIHVSKNVYELTSHD